MITSDLGQAFIIVKDFTMINAQIVSLALNTLELLTNIYMLAMVEKWIRGGICHAIHRYTAANNKYMKNCNKDKESSCLMYLDANNLYGWAMF